MPLLLAIVLLDLVAVALRIRSPGCNWSMLYSAALKLDFEDGIWKRCVRMIVRSRSGAF